MDAVQEVNTNTLKEFLEAFNRHDLDGVMSFFSDAPTLEMPRGPHPWGTRGEGRDEIRRLLATRFEGLPDAHYAEDRHFVCANRGVSEWLLTGTTRDGTQIRVRGCDLFEFEGGKIRRKDSYWKIVE
jgi:ketosteroid isomerase-like protein